MNARKSKNGECGSKKGALKSNVKGNKGEMVKGWWESMLDGKLYVCVWEVGGWDDVMYLIIMFMVWC